MRLLLVVVLLHAGSALGQIPDEGRFDYVLYDNGDRPVGHYAFTIARDGKLWRVTSEMVVDTTFLFLRIRLRDRNSFTHDGASFQSFDVDYFKDVPLQATVDRRVSGKLAGAAWTIRATENGKSGSRSLSRGSFDEVRNLVSRLVRPEAVLRPGEARTTRSLDPLTLRVDEVETRGVGTETVDFQGRRRELFVMETKAADGDVRVKKFANGLIYRSQTGEGYALLKSARMPLF